MKLLTLNTTRPIVVAPAPRNGATNPRPHRGMTALIALGLLLGVQAAALAALAPYDGGWQQGALCAKTNSAEQMAECIALGCSGLYGGPANPNAPHDVEACSAGARDNWNTAHPKGPWLVSPEAIPITNPGIAQLYHLSHKSNI